MHCLSSSLCRKLSFMVNQLGKRDKNPMQTAAKRLPNGGKRRQTTGDKQVIYKVFVSKAFCITYTQ